MSFTHISFLFLLLLKFSPLTLIGQDQSVIDQFNRDLRNAQNDKQRLDAHLGLADEYLFCLPDSAQYHSIKGYELAEELEELGKLAKLSNFRGIVEHNHGHYLSALELYQKSRSVYAQLGDMEGAVKALNNIGIIYGVIGEPHKAIASYLESLQYNEEHGLEVQASRNLFNVAMSYLELKEFDLARGYVERLKEYQNGSKEMANPLTLEAELLLHDGKLDEALSVVRSALEIATTGGDLSNEGSLHVLKAEILRSMGRTGEALASIQKASTLADEYDFNDIKIEALAEKVNILSAMGLYDKAYFNQKELIRTKDSLDGINKMNIMSELNTKYETEKRDAEIALQSQQLQSKSFWMFVISLSTIALAVIIFMIYFTLQKKKRLNGLLTRQNQEIKSQRQKIISSISYAKRIQHSSLIPPGRLQEIFKESFIFFKPKDIVSGDFYWFRVIDNMIYLAVVDCTGHGVPGAFMSLIAAEKLNKAVGEMGLRDPGEIITAVNKQIIESLNQESAPENAQDGLDLSLCLVNQHTGEIKFSGANSSIIILNDKNEFNEVRSTALGVGGAIYGKMYKNGFCFETTSINYQSGDYLFMFTDGFHDQFGGLDLKKFNKGQFREMLKECSNIGLNNSHEFCNNIFEQWRGSTSQTDDILVLGVRL
ncbi:MAG: SpoIIE family protein phosphatase [Flavobacteriales bacterium]|nr:SpoIIE family protein phosphatase [Flavobacteriales bacterium]